MHQDSKRLADSLGLPLEFMDDIMTHPKEKVEKVFIGKETEARLGIDVPIPELIQFSGRMIPVDEFVQQVSRTHAAHIEIMCAAFLKLCPNIPIMEVELIQEQIKDDVKGITYRWFFRRKT